MAPLSDLLGHCNATLMSMHSQVLYRGHRAGYSMVNRDAGGFLCEASCHSRIQRRFLSGNVLGIILVGYLRMSSTSRRLQLIDATGCIDVVVPDLPTDHNEMNIYEVNIYNIIIEWDLQQVESPASVINRPLSCRSIFQPSQLRLLSGPTVYLHFYLSNSTCLNALLQRPLENRNDHMELNAAFHILVISHKFPSHCNVVNGLESSNHSSAFAEAFLLPYKLIVLPEYDNIQELDEMMIKSNGIDDDKSAHAGRSFFRSQNVDGDKIFEHSNGCVDGGSKAYEIPCLFLNATSKYRGLLRNENLFTANSILKENGNSQQTVQKLLLEFKSDSYYKHQSLYVGGFFILKCSDEELLCNDKQSRRCLDFDKVIVNCQKLFLSFSFMTVESLDQDRLLQNQSQGFFLDENNEVPLDIYSYTGLIFHQNQEGQKQICDAQLLLSDSSMKLVKAMIKSERYGSNISHPLLSKIHSVSSFMEIVQAASAHSSGPGSSALFDGNLISLRGNVVDVHFLYNLSDHSTYTRNENIFGNYQSRARFICIHVCEENHMVKIVGMTGKLIFPLGFGPGVNATFHRLQVTRNSGRWNELTFVSASHIVVNSVSEVIVNVCEGSCLQATASNIQNKNQFDGIHSGLIGSGRFLESNVVQMRCRVSRILYLMLEQPNSRSWKPELLNSGLKTAVNIPIAAFVLDDGSSVCCCWADSDKAELLLRLKDTIRRTFVGQNISTRSDTKRIGDTIGCRLEKILKKHRRIMVTSCGVVSDSSHVDITLCVSSNKLLRKLDEKLLKSIMLYALQGHSFNVIGRTMDFNVLGYLKKVPMEIQTAKHLAARHIWATEVGSINLLADARGLLNELLDGS